MTLFTVKQIKKFFEILGRLERSVSVDKSKQYYHGYIYTNSTPCQKEVFVHRTLNKWFKNKYAILYRLSEQTETQYCQYVSISNISYALTWSEEISVNLYDYSRPMDIFNNLKLNHNDCLRLEGKWVSNPKNYHHKLLKMTMLSIPEKEFKFKAYDFSKYPKRAKTDEERYEKMTTEIIVKAKTNHEAYQKLDELEKKNIKEGKEIMIIK
jgi:hypothetical protein